MRKEQDHENLRLNLRQFGLNPAQWTLKQSGPGMYLVVNREDQGFSLQGRTTGRQGRRRWAGLMLRSV